ncbi:MAG: hypothetical protein GY856_12115 [bacterium]|nr:hypothetical protein [bacterium]
MIIRAWHATSVLGVRFPAAFGTHAVQPFLAMLLVTQLGLATSTAAVELRFQAVVQGDAQAPVDGLLTASPAVDETIEAAPEPVAVPFTAQEETRIDLRSGMAWKVSMAAEGYWSPETLVVPNASHEPVAVKLYPTATVTGRLEIPGRAELPEDLTLRTRFRSAGSRTAADAALEGTVDCALEEGRFDCLHPAGTFDLRLRATGFVSHYLWRQTIEPGATLVAGTLELERGASLVGWVETEDETPVKQCRIELAPEVSGHPTPAEEARSSILKTGADVGEREFFHLTGLLPGSYVLTATMEGFAPTRIPHLLVKEDAEAELRDPVMLLRPLDLTVTVAPSTDPSGGGWVVMLLHTAETEPTGMGRTDADGIWVRKATRPGNYYLQISDSRGARMVFEEIELNRSQTAFLYELRFVEVEGRVTLGEEPLPATLFFGGSKSVVSIEAKADSEGLFSAIIPQKESWPVDVMAREPRVFRRLRNLEIIPRPGMGKAWLDIELPDTLLEGKVVDQDDQPVADARILSLQVPAAEMPTYTTTDQNGEFSFRGIAEGTHRLEAHASSPAGALVSDAVETELTKQSPTASVRIVVRRVVELAGTVFSPAGPVPGAAIQFKVLDSHSPTNMIIPQTQSAGDGSFTLELPAGFERGDVIVEAPGFVLNRQRLVIDAGKPLDIPLTQEGGGTLVIHLTSPLGWSRIEKPLPYVIHDGIFHYGFGRLRRWAQLNGVTWDELRVEIPKLPPGSYSVCWHLETAENERESECIDGFLPPAGELTIDEENR